MAMAETVLCQPLYRRPPLRFLSTSRCYSTFVCSSGNSPLKRRTELSRLNYLEKMKNKKSRSGFGSCTLKILNQFHLISSPSTTGGTAAATGRDGGGSSATDELDEDLRKILLAILWIAECVYVVWLFLLPYAPGDPVWAISSDTIKDLVGLSLNFFFILPLSNTVGVHLLEAPVLHPMSEGLFNFVVGWTLMFAPLLYTDRKRNGFKGSLDILWSLQMFLTNTFLIPYMAIRLNNSDADTVSGNKNSTSKLGSIMINGASLVGLIGGTVCVFSILWALFGRPDSNFGNISERIEFLTSYLGSERLAYAFIWDIVLYTIFQPWLIGDNLKNIEKDKVGVVNYLRFVPVLGLVAYCLSLNQDTLDN